MKKLCFILSVILTLSLLAGCSVDITIRDENGSSIPLPDNVESIIDDIVSDATTTTSASNDTSESESTTTELTTAAGDESTKKPTETTTKKNNQDGENNQKNKRSRQKAIRQQTHLYNPHEQVHYQA